MNKKLILSLGMVVFSMLTLASCKAKHTHTFGGSFQYNETQHWKVCDKDGCSEVSGKEDHHGGTATCTELAKCEDCGVSYGSKLSHAFTESKVDAKYLVSAADCDSAAVYYKSCICGEKGTETFTSGNALGHTFTEWATKTPADCLNAEVEERSCACGHKETRTGDAALGHDLEMKHDANQHWEECKREGCEHATAKENHKGGAATATEQAKCSVCGTAYGELADHEHTFTKQIEDEAYLATEATCTEDATYYYGCTAEGCSAVSTTTWTKENSKLGHDMGEWSTVGKDGNKTQECSRCDHSVTEFALGTSEDPISVDAALEAMAGYVGGDKSTAVAYVSGVVVKVEENYSGVGYYKITIANSATSVGKLVVFQPTYDGTLSVGDEVIAKGNLELYVKDEVSTYEVVSATFEEVTHKNTFDIAYSIVDEAGAASTNATVSTIPATSQCCETINFTVTPSTGYVVEVFVNNTEISAKEGNTYSVKVTEDLTIKIVAKQKQVLASPYNYTFTAKTITGAGNVKLGDVIWNVEPTWKASASFGFDSQYGRGQQIGTGNNPATKLVMKTSDIPGEVGTIKINTSGASSIAGKLVVTVGGTQVGTEITLTSQANEYTINAEGLKGEVVLTWTQTSSKALYIKSIYIEFVANTCEHSFVEEVLAEDANLAEAADCDNAAKYYKVCEHCGAYSEDTFSHGNALGHSYGAWTITVEPTETTVGSAERVCSRNNAHKETKELPVLTDTTVWTSAVTEPECGVKGKTTYTSEYGVVEVEIAALEHNYEGQEWLVSTEGTGGHYKLCKLCNEPSEVEAHRGGEATETEQATCEVCNNKYGETLDHTHSYVVEKVHSDYLDTAADCVNNATYYKSCSCGESSKGTEFEATFEDKDTALGHATADELDWIIEEDGHSKKCSCGHVVIEKAAHEGGEATCAVKAVCTVCKASYGELDSEHAWGEWSKPTLAGVSTRVCANDATHKEENNNAFGTKENPLTVAETKAAMSGFASGNKATVKGWIKGYVVSAEYTPYNGKDQWEYFIVDSLADTSSRFQLYGCYTGGVTEGDFIVATGYFKKFNSTYEFDYSNTVESIVHNDYPINTEIEYADDVDATVTVNIVKSAKSGENVSFTLSGDEGCKVTVTINGTTTLEPVDGTYSFVVSYKNDIRIFVEPKKEGAVEETWSHTFASGQLSNNNTKTLSNKKWTLNLTGGTYIGWDSNNGRGIQLGKSSAAATKATLKSSEFPGTIKSIVVNSSIGSGGTAKISISVNEVSYLASTALTTTAKDYVGTGTQSGEIVISWTNTAKAFYIKSIEIVYEEYVAPSCEHEGGEATCKELAVCTKCGESYGELNVNNHKGTAEWTKDADSHKKVYSCCNKVVVAEEAHEWENGVCKECEYVCTHTERTLQGKEATCTEKGLTEGKDCSVCGKVLVAQEEIPMLDHTYSTPNYDNDNHWNECSCGAKENVGTHAHAYAYINDNGTLKYVGTCECGHIVSEVVEEKEVSVSNEADLRNVLASGHNAVVESNLDLSTRVEVTKAVTVTVKENATLSVKNDTEGYGVFHVLAGGELTLNGKGTIDGLGNNPWSICIFADGGKVIIEEGNYTNVGAHSENDGSHFDLIYVKNGGTVTINGGTFICETPKWTLNSNDTLKGTFVVKGGTFYGYNPADNTTENPVVNWVAEGYHASKVGDNYEVVACEANETKLVVDGGKLYEVVSCSCGYELSREEVNAEETVEVSNKADLLAVIESGYNVKLTSDVEVETAIVVAKDVTVDLNGKTISLPTDTVGDGVFHVTSGATLTINGEGTVNGVGANDYNMAIWADGGHVVINGGTYTNVGATANVDPAHFDLIYVKNGGTVTINGGTFTCETPKWTLNSHDTSKGTFVVKGGTFYGYNPADNTTENPVVNWVAEGYHASKVGDNYEVVACEHSYEANVTAPTVDADGYTTFTCSKCGDEYVEVDEGTNLAKASVNGKNYLTVEEAIAAAEEGDTVTLVKDLTYKDILVINKSIILDGNNKTLTSTAGRAINVSGTLTVTIKNLIINCSGERGINLIGGPSIVTIEKCNIKAANYAINLANSASGAEATIKECEITGCNSVNVGAANSKVIIEDSVINSIDNSTYEGYAAIALNKDGANTEITATNTEINILGSSCEDTVKAQNHTENGKISIGSDIDNKIDVAFIEYGNYYYGYKTLAEAIEAALEGETIGLLRNVEVTESLVINKQITIDLRGFSITVAEGYEVENIFDVAEGYHVVKVGDTYVYGEHSYEANVTAPTCTAEGYTLHTCSNCGYYYKDEIKNALGHSWAENWSSDADTHWHECTRDNCEETDGAVAHSGGTATSKEKAICSSCGTSYGELLVAVYYYNSNDWDTICAYIWVEGGENISGAWPGSTTMLKQDSEIGENWYYVELEPQDNLFVIFNNNNKGAQTANLEVGETNSYYYGSGSTKYNSLDDAIDAYEKEQAQEKRVIYVKVCNTWVNAVTNPRFCAVFTDSSWKNTYWVDLVKVNGNIYSVEVPNDSTITQVQFQRMNVNDYGNDVYGWDYKWNSSSTITLDTSKNLVTMSNAWDGSTGTWSTYSA